MDTTIADHVALRHINDTYVTTCLILRTWNAHGIRNMGMRQSIAPCAFIYPHLPAWKILTAWKLQTPKVHQCHLTAFHPRRCHTNLQQQMLPGLSSLDSVHPRQSLIVPVSREWRLKQQGKGHQTHKTKCIKGTKAHRSSRHTQIAHIKALYISY